MMPSAYLSALSEMSKNDIFSELVIIHGKLNSAESNQRRLTTALENLLSADGGGFIWEQGLKTDAREEAQETLDHLEEDDDK